MTTQSFRLKLARIQVLKLKNDVRFPVTIDVGEFITLAKSNGRYAFGIDYTLLDASPVIDPSLTLLAVYDQNSHSYKAGSISSLIAQASAIDQHITAAGPVTILNNAGIARVDQTVGASITVTMPLASVKTCPVLISDWKGDAGTNNITINLSGGDKFPGGLTSWKIAADTGSVFLRPISGVGYAL